MLGPQAANIVVDRLADIQPSRSRLPHLTAREHEILELMAAGRPNGSIAGTLGISRKTVANHVANILAKLHAADRGSAIVQARDAGYGR